MIKASAELRVVKAPVVGVTVAAAVVWTAGAELGANAACCGIGDTIWWSGELQPDKINNS